MQELHVARFCAPSLVEVWNLYKEKRELSSKTIRIYEFVWSWGFADWMHRAIDTITELMIEDRHRELSNKKGPRGNGKASADLCMRTLRAIINFAKQRFKHEDGVPIVQQNPVAWLSETRQWNPRVKRSDIINESQLPIFFSVVNKSNDQNLRDYLYLMLFTGLRRMEAGALQWKNVDFQSNLLTAKRKGKKIHTIPLPPFVVQFLTYRYYYMRPAPDDYVFPGSVPGTHISENYKGYEKLFDDLGFKFKLHSLRRTFLTTARKCQLDYVVIQWLANHSISDVTFQYLIEDPEQLREPIHKISYKLLELGGISST